MHDLVHDLAQSVAKPDCISRKSYPILNSSIKVQHLSIMEDDTTGDVVLSELVGSQPQLRSFLLFATPLSFNSFIETSIYKFKLLRMLRLRKFSGNVLPESIGSLWHLRLLDLTGSRIRSLPNSVCNLVCLEVLRLGLCVKLEKLPAGLGKLIRLKTLYVTTKERCLPEKEFRCLTALQSLHIYRCENMESLLSDDGIYCLSSLRILLVSSCSSLVSLPTNGLREMHKLENLVIDFCQKLNLQLDDQHRYCEGGRESDLRTITFTGLPMLVTLPSWLIHGADTLKEIVITSCLNLTAMMPEPLFENLKCLERLDIIDCPELKSLPTGMHHLTALTEFWVMDCPQLVSRCTRDTGEDWHKISHVPKIYLDLREV